MVRVLSVLLLAGIPCLPQEDRADALWARAQKAYDARAWDEGRALLQLFRQRHPADPRAAEAERRLSGNAFLCAVPYGISGPSANRIDVYMSADGMLGTAKDQDLLRRIAVTTFEEAMRLRPFDAYWSYFNWHVAHAGSRRNGLNPRAAKDDYDTCFGGMSGDKNFGGKDACMDFEHARDRFVKPHLPDCDFFLVRVEGHNGWPPPWGMCAAVVGTSHLRYAPQALSDLRLDDGELPGYDLILPALKERFAAAWAAFQQKLEAERPKVAGLTVREWRARTAARAASFRRGAGEGEVRIAANSVTDKKRYPDSMKLGERPFPDFSAVPWIHWLEKGDPSATVYPLLLSGLYNVKSKDFRPRADGELEVAAEGAKLDEIKRHYGGRLPTDREIREKMYVTLYAHDRCFLGAWKLEDRADPATQFCAVCLEETVRSIYRKVSPVDARRPAEEPVERASASEFVVEVLKPLDHFLTVEWRVDGKPRTAGRNRRILLRSADGSRKAIAAAPPFLSQPRGKAYFDPAKETPGVAKSLVASRLLAARVTVEERLTLDPEELGPGEHVVEATVIDETPWVLWDPEDLLTRRVKWTVK